MVRSDVPRDRVLTLSELAALGVLPAAVRRRVARGDWSRLHPGVYFTGRRPDLAARALAALTWAGPDAVVTGLAALALHGVPQVRDPPVLELLVPRHRRPRPSGEVRVRRTDTLDPTDVRVRRGVRLTSPARATLDAVRAGTLREARALVSDVVREGYVRLGDLVALADQVGGKARGRWLRPVLDEVDAGSRSFAECELAALLERAGLLQRFDRQVRVDLGAGSRAAVLDLLARDVGLGIEVDGAAWHTSAAAWRRDLSRQNALLGRGIVLLRFSPREVRAEPDQVLATVAAALRQRARAVAR